MLSYHPTPIQEIQDEHLKQAAVRLLIKREDLNHPLVSGNKWWKLKYNLQAAFEKKATTILTYGGAFSNHIFATAAAAKEVGLKSVGIIRGEETLPLNPILSFARNQGMELVYIPRSAYRAKTSSDDYLSEFENFHYVAEGGSNELAVKGIKDFLSNVTADYDYLCCPVGTGGTVSGLIEGAREEIRVIGFPVLKGAEFLLNDIKMLSDKSKHTSNWQLMFDYHFGGYAKTTTELFRFIEEFKDLHRVPLERIYTGKMMAGIYDLLKKGFFKRGSTILAIHTGGVHMAELYPPIPAKVL
jgi:1-aminocyclopropane-1-carboxylate deaminase